MKISHVIKSVIRPVHDPAKQAVLQSAASQSEL